MIQKCAQALDNKLIINYNDYILYYNNITNGTIERKQSACKTILLQ